MSFVRLLASVLLFGSVLSANPRLELFKKDLESKNIVRIEEALRLISVQDRSHFTLMKGSIGLQEASLEAPRALVFGETADLIFTFNSHETQGGGSDLEIMSFNPQTETYDFEVISFKGGQRLYSEKNPPLCIGCHSTLGKPLWGSKGLNPRAFGGNHDLVTAEEMKTLSWLRENSRMQYLIRNEIEPQAPYRLILQDQRLEAQPNLRFARAIEKKYVQTLKKRLNKVFFKDNPFWVEEFLLDRWQGFAAVYAPQIEPLLQKYLNAEELEMLSRIIESLGSSDEVRFHYMMTVMMFGVPADPWVLDQVNTYSLNVTYLTEASLKQRLYEELFAVKTAD
jgi:hypothetical protein